MLILYIILFCSISHAADVQFSWFPNETDHVTGYRIYYGKKSGEYSIVTDVGLPEIIDGRHRAIVSGIPNGDKLYYAATAYNEDAESDYSNEVIYREPWPKPHRPEDFKK